MAAVGVYRLPMVPVVLCKSPTCNERSLISYRLRCAPRPRLASRDSRVGRPRAPLCGSVRDRVSLCGSLKKNACTLCIIAIGVWSHALPLHRTTTPTATTTYDRH